MHAAVHALGYGRALFHYNGAVEVLADKPLIDEPLGELFEKSFLCDCHAILI